MRTVGTQAFSWSHREIKHGSGWNAERRRESAMHRETADKSGERPGAPEIRPRLPLASESWRCPERAGQEMNCHHACRKSVREKVSPVGCTSGRILSCGGTASCSAAEVVWLPRPVVRPRIIRRRAGSRLNLPWRRMMLNKRGSR